MSTLKEKCGIFAICGEYDDAIGTKMYNGLCALQHRGQESAGAVIIGEEAVLIKQRGLVHDVFAPDNLHCHGGRIAMGHVRYGHDSESDKETQPIVLPSNVGDMYLAFNGYITNYHSLVNDLPEQIRLVDDNITDIECIGYMLLQNIKSPDDIVAALKQLHNKLKGAYCIVIIAQNTVYCMRDRFGFRPLCYGRTINGQYVFASETCALHAVSATIDGEIRPGEIVVCDGSSITFDTEYCGKAPCSLCCFEYFYFANKNSVVGGNLVTKIRCDAGRLLARKAPVHCDLVIGVPDSGIDAAKGFAKEANLPYAVGFVRNEMVRRTFIVPNQKERERLVQQKLTAIPEVVGGKDLVVVDDSIVRGTTAIHIVKLLRNAGAKTIHLRICSPKFIYDCPYGTDIGARNTLIAYNHTTEEIAHILGVDSLAFLEPSDIDILVGGGYSTVCKACFDGKYPDGNDIHD